MKNSDKSFETESFEKQPKDKRRASSTIWYLIFAFLFAVAIWFFRADSNAVVTKTFNGVPIVFDPPKDTTLAVESVNVSHVNVTVFGTKENINDAKIEDFKLHVDATGAVSEGTFDMILEVEQLPPGLTLVEENGLSETEVEVVFVKNTKKSVKISEYEFIGSWNREYQLVPIFTPEWVTAEGSTSILNQIEKAKVVLDVGALERPKEVRTEVILLDNDGNEISVSKNNLKLSEKYVNVYVQMNMKKELPVKVEFSGNILNADTDSVYKCDPEFVTVSGSVSELSKMEYIPIVIDERDIEDKTYNGTVFLPDYSDKRIEYINLPNNEVNVDIALRDVLTTSIIVNTENIKAVGLKDGMSAEFIFYGATENGEEPESMAITFHGYSDAIRELRKVGVDGIDFEVDFKDLETSIGQNIVNLSVKITSKQPGVWTTDKINVKATIVESTETSEEESVEESEISSSGF